MASITINNVDEQVERNFELFCANAGMNMSAAFGALVKIGLSINEQGLLANPSDEIHRRQKTAVKKFLTDIATIEDDDNVLTDADWDEMANLRALSNAGLARTIEV